MPNYCVLEGNLIVSIIISENKEIAETVTGKSCVECPHKDVGTGWIYEGGTFSAPIIETLPEPIIEVLPNPTE